MGKVLYAVSLLLIGAAIGTGLIYAGIMFGAPATNVPNNNPPVADVAPSITTPPPVLENKFELVKQTIDLQPESVNNLIQDPQSPEEYYLIGRASVQLGEYENARAAFARADQLLAQLPDDNKLKVDLAIAQAAIGGMTQTFSDRRKLIELVKLKQANKNSSAEVNQLTTNP